MKRREGTTDGTEENDSMYEQCGILVVLFSFPSSLAVFFRLQFPPKPTKENNKDCKRKQSEERIMLRSVCLSAFLSRLLPLSLSLFL